MLLREKKIKEILDLINSAGILIHGIGTAAEMARRRGADPAEMERLHEQGAVGEGFGFFYNKGGEILFACYF